MDYSYMARKATAKKAEGIMEPLLDAIVEDSDVESEFTTARSFRSDTLVKRAPLQKIKIFSVYLLISGGVAVSVASMILAPLTAVFIMGGVFLVNAPFTAIKEKKIGNLPTLRAMNNRLREDTNRLELEVEALHEEIDILKPEADRTAEVEDDLRLLTLKQNINVDKLIELVRENDEILSKMRTNLQQRIAQDIITIVLKSDKNNNSTIDRFESKILALRIRLQLQEYGVEFDAAKFMIAIRKDPSATGVMNLAMKLLGRVDSDGGSDDANEQTKDDGDIFDIFYLASDDSECRTSLFDNDRCKSDVSSHARRMSTMSSNSSRSRRFSINAKDTDMIRQCSVKMTDDAAGKKSITMRLLEEGRPEASARLLKKFSSEEFDSD